MEIIRLFYCFSVQLKKQMIWTDDLLDPETEEFANKKKEIEEEVIFATFLMNSINCYTSHWRCN